MAGGIKPASRAVVGHVLPPGGRTERALHSVAEAGFVARIRETASLLDLTVLAESAHDAEAAAQALRKSSNCSRAAAILASRRSR